MNTSLRYHRLTRSIGMALGAGACLIPLMLVGYLSLPARGQIAMPGASGATGPVDESSIENRLHILRRLSDNKRAIVTKQLALEIRRLPQPDHRLALASSLANLATEGDFGHDTLQEVATTLAEALQATSAQNPSGNVEAYSTLAQLVRYENVQTTLKSPQFTKAMAQIDAADRKREQANFTLTDLNGKSWTLKSLHGKVVLVNFWATWCPPCRKELPDLETLYQRFKNQGLVVLGITDEDAPTVRPFVAKQKMTYPILLDNGRKVGELFEVQGIPRSLVYGRNGKLAAEAIDMRTQHQMLALLARAGLK